MLESLFNEIAALPPYKFIEKRLAQVFSCGYCEFLKNFYFEKQMRTAASDYSFTLVIYLFSAVSLQL